MLRLVLLLLPLALAVLLWFGLRSAVEEPPAASAQPSPPSVALADAGAPGPALAPRRSTPGRPPAANARPDARSALARLNADESLVEQIAFMQAEALRGDREASRWLAMSLRRCLSLPAWEGESPDAPLPRSTWHEECEAVPADLMSWDAVEHWLRRAADLGDWESAIDYHGMVPELLGGYDGVLANLDRAVEYRERGRMYLEGAAAAGQPRAFAALAYTLLGASNLGPADPERALAYALAYARHPEAKGNAEYVAESVLEHLSQDPAFDARARARSEALAERLLARCCPGS